MDNFAYFRPQSLHEAVSTLNEHREQARVLAGGTDLLVQLREGLRQAGAVVDVKQIPECTELVRDGDHVRLGASTPCWRIYENAEIAAAVPALADAARIIGGWQIQARASVGGNLCNGSPAADTIPPLMVHAAVCRIQSSEGPREVPVKNFCIAPGKTVLQPHELLVTLEMDALAAHAGSAYERFIPRNEMDIAVAGAASWVQLDDSQSKIEGARIALAAIAPTPVLAEEAAQWLVGKPATPEGIAGIEQIVQQVAKPIDDMRGTQEYRVHLTGVLARRTLLRAIERARNGI